MGYGRYGSIPWTGPEEEVIIEAYRGLVPRGIVLMIEEALYYRNVYGSKIFQTNMYFVKYRASLIDTTVPPDLGFTYVSLICLVRGKLLLEEGLTKEGCGDLISGRTDGKSSGPRQAATLRLVNTFFNFHHHLKVISALQSPYGLTS